MRHNELLSAIFSVAVTLILAMLFRSPASSDASGIALIEARQGKVSVVSTQAKSADVAPAAEQSDFVELHKAIASPGTDGQSNQPQTAALGAAADGDRRIADTQQFVPSADMSGGEDAGETTATVDSLAVQATSSPEPLAADRHGGNSEEKASNAAFERANGVWQPTFTILDLPAVALEQSGDLAMIMMVGQQSILIKNDLRGSLVLEQFVPNPFWSDVALGVSPERLAALNVHLRDRAIPLENLGTARYLASRRLLAVIRGAQQAAAAHYHRSLEEVLETSGRLLVDDRSVRYSIADISFRTSEHPSALSADN